MLIRAVCRFKPDLEEEENSHCLVALTFLSGDLVSPLVRGKIIIKIILKKRLLLSSKIMLTPFSPVSRTSRAELSHSLCSLLLSVRLSVSSFLAGFPPPPSTRLLVLLLLLFFFSAASSSSTTFFFFSSSSSRHPDEDGAARDACARAADAAPPS